MNNPFLDGALIALVTVFAMEAVAYCVHRFVMHGVGWVLHRSHHEPRTGFWEHNDLFGILFAGISMAMISVSSAADQLFWVGIGMACYGLLYFLVHDGLVHRRFRFVGPPRSGYLSHLVRAHHMHHAVKTRDGAISFGFLYAPPLASLSRVLRSRRGQ
ncbi:sterol desaturase family protein [Sphingomonas sp. SRS2]|uniref:sterol desaturase family protein n=1 Tax=Sphingomonas sp. SRS2 TaxID=133190 RepID=UPI0006184A9C|nr:sterol desaturase family protein [Sphingomonas sp. SRS2]KKC26038.1 beta-carotene hydroxylase [Sphingomonas sp. SRS2]